MIGISLCMIVKNEEKNIKKCLESVVDIVDEIIVVDTGSVDNTKNIVTNFTDKLFDYRWNNDFADARNYSVSFAENDWILILDADECIKMGNKDDIVDIMKENEYSIGRIVIESEYTRQGQKYIEIDHVARLFSKKYYTFDGVIHEQLVPLNGIPKKSFELDLVISHSGYSGDFTERNRKANRNIELLMKAKDTSDNKQYISYQIGKSYYMIEDYGNARKYFEEAMQYNLRPELDYVQDLVETYGYSLINTGKYKEAMNFLDIYDEFSGSADFLFLIAHILLNNEYYVEAINEFLKATQANICKVVGVNEYLSYYNIGVIYECLGEKSKAIYYYRKSIGYYPAEDRLKQLL